MISFVVAFDQNRVIGCEQKLPWHLPADLKRFRALTLQRTVIMGRKTYESIGRPLPERTNIVISRQELQLPEGVLLAHSPEEALDIANHDREECMVIGGADLFAQLLPRAEKLYLTIVEGSFLGDCYFPELDMAFWDVQHEEYCPADVKNIVAHRFLILQRKC